MTNLERESLKRCETLLDAVIRFVEVNPVAEYTVFYDDAECDGYCLQDDCEAALHAVRAALKQ